MSNVMKISSVSIVIINISENNIEIAMSKSTNLINNAISANVKGQLWPIIENVSIIICVSK